MLDVVAPSVGAGVGAHLEQRAPAFPPLPARSF